MSLNRWHRAISGKISWLMWNVEPILPIHWDVLIQLTSSHIWLWTLLVYPVPCIINT